MADVAWRPYRDPPVIKRGCVVRGETVDEYLARGGAITQVAIGESGVTDGYAPGLVLDGSPVFDADEKRVSGRGGWRR